MRLPLKIDRKSRFYLINPMNDKKLCTWAWLLVGMTRSLPGILKFENGRLNFTNDEQGKIFDVSLAEISKVNFPWHYFGAGLKLKVDGNEYRLSFIELDDGNSVSYNFLNSIENVTDLSGRAAGKAWKAILKN